MLRLAAITMMLLANCASVIAPFSIVECTRAGGITSTRPIGVECECCEIRNNAGHAEADHDHSDCSLSEYGIDTTRLVSELRSPDECCRHTPLDQTPAVRATSETAVSIADYLMLAAEAFVQGSCLEPSDCRALTVGMSQSPFDALLRAPISAILRC